MWKIASVLAALFGTAVIAPAQESRATLIGRITDPTGALVSGATVRTTNVATNSTVTTTANESGAFEVLYLIPTLDNGQTFIATLSNPFPNGIDSAQGSAGGLNAFLGRGVSSFTASR